MTKANKEPAISFEVYPHDLPNTMTFLDAEKEVAKLGGGWRIPTLEELRLMYKNKDSTFCTKPSNGSDCPGWYWSSTEGRGHSSRVHGVRFSDGGEGWDPKDDGRLSCRPVRLVAAKPPITDYLKDDPYSNEREIKTLFPLIRSWASDRNLIKGASTHAQMLKLSEEMGELAAGIARSKPEAIKDGIGDCVVVLTILAAQYDMRIEDCVATAYAEIKDRKGQMINGVFVKEE